MRVHDRVAAGEMPPRPRKAPAGAEAAAFLAALADPLIATDRAREAAEGRATRRRLNRHEYENTVRVLFRAPWLQLRDQLPEDGEAFRFNKVGDALDVSHVQMAQYMAAAEYAMREVLAAQAEPLSPTVTRYYARQMRSFTRLMSRASRNKGHLRDTFPVLGFAAQPDVRARDAPMSVGASNPARRDLEGKWGWSTAPTNPSSRSSRRSRRRARADTACA